MLNASLDRLRAIAALVAIIAIALVTEAGRRWE